MNRILIIILISLFFFAMNALASDYNYDVSGYGGSGYVYGEIEANSGNKDVEGYLYDEYGNTVYFKGEWSGYGEVVGYDENGNYINLEIVNIDS